MANPASEQTLQELLETARLMNESLTKLSTVMGKSVGGGTGAATEKSAKAAADAQQNLANQTSKLVPHVDASSKSFAVLNSSVSAASKFLERLGGIFSGLVSTVSNMAGVLGEFTAVAAQGKMQLSDMVGFMGKFAEQIPIVGGLLGSLAGPIKFVMQRMEESYDAYKKISQVGVTFGGSLTELRMRAQAANMTVDQFASALQRNGALIATAGSDTEKGADILSNALATTAGPGSKIFRSLAGMGYSADQAASLTETYLATQGTLSKKELQDQNVISKGVLELGHHMQNLSEITGKRKEQIEAELKEAAEEANWKNFIAGITDPEEITRINKALTTASATMGKDGVEAVKVAIRTGFTGPVTEAGKRMFVTTQGTSVDLVTSLMKSAKKGGEIYDKEVMSNAVKMGKSAQVMQDSVGGIAQIHAANGKQLLSADATNFATRLKGIKNEEEFQKLWKEISSKNANLGKTQAGELGTQQQNLKSFGNLINNIIDTLAGPFIGPIMQMTGPLLDIMTKFAKLIQPQVDLFGGWFMKWVGTFTKVDSWEGFKKAMMAFWEDIKAWTGPRIKKLWEEEIGPIVVSGFKFLLKAAWDAIKSMLYSLLPDFMKGSDTGEVSDQEKYEKQAVEAERARKELADAKQTIYQAEQNEIKKKAFIESAKAGMGEKAAKEKAAEYFKGPSEEALANAKRVVAGQPPAPDQSQLIRDWAYKIMTRQENESAVPAEIRDKVKEAQNDPGVKKLAEEYRASVEKENAEKKAAMEKAAAEAKAETAKAQQKKPELGTQPVLTPAGAARASQTSAETSSDLLNKQLAQLITINRDTAEAAQRTANLIASNGNLFRRS